MILVFVLVPPCLVITAAVVVASFLKPHGAHAFADPADTTDPDGEEYGSVLRDMRWDVWEQRASEMATAPGRLAMLPPDPDPDPTLVQPHDVKYLGKPSKVLVEEIFEKHAPKPEMLP